MLSPDGKFVAYLRREGRDGAEFSLWVRQTATQSDVVVVPFVPGRVFVGLVVTPDGDYVDFVARENGVRRPDLWRVPFLGGTARLISRDVWSATGWAPDGRHMAFIRTKAGAGEDSVVIADADGTNERVLDTRRTPVRFRSDYNGGAIARPSWSADGRSLLVLGTGPLPEGRGRADQLVVIDVATGAETKVVPLDGLGLTEAAWVDESHALVSGQMPATAPAIYRVDLATGALAPATPALAAFVGVSVTADRRAAVTTLFDGRSGIWVGDAAGGSMTAIVPETSGSDMSVALDGVGGLVYTAPTTSGVGVFAIGAGQRTPALVVDNATAPRVTRDGKTVVFRRGGITAGLYRVNIDGSGLMRFVEGTAANAVILSDDRTVVYRAVAPDGTSGIWSAPLLGGQSREILKQFVGNTPFRMSPDGRVLRFYAGVANGRSVSMLCDLPDCTNPRPTEMRPGQWTPDGRSIAFADSTDPKNIWLQPIDGGAPRALTTFTEKDITSFTWSPDGKRLAITRGTVVADIVLLKGIR